MNATAAKLRRLSLFPYTLLFGAIFGDMMRHMSMEVPSEFLFYVCILAAFIGSVMLVVKNRAIPDSNKRIKVMVAEICVTLCLILISYGLPDYLGLVKYATFTILMAVYLGFYFSFLFKGRFQ